MFTANPANCPAASVVGTAKAVTPVLSAAMVGPAYFVSNGKESLPDVDIVLQGDGVRLNLRGSTFVSKKDFTSVTFRSVPDIPLRSVELNFPEGRYSAFGTDKDLCKPRSCSKRLVGRRAGPRACAVVVKAARSAVRLVYRGDGRAGGTLASFAGRLMPAVVLRVVVVGERRGRLRSAGEGWERLQALERGGELC